MYTDGPVRKNEVYYPCCVEPYPDATFTVRLRRRALYYNLYLIVPTAAVAALTLLGFILPPDSGEKIGLGTHVESTFIVCIHQRIIYTSYGCSTPMFSGMDTPQ